ncbi:efflux RND transporter permease subunit [Persephonella sp.]
MEKFTRFILKNHHTTISLIIIFSIIGIYGYFQQDRNLFPDADRPQVAVVITQEGSSAKDIAENIVIPVEKQLYTIDKLITVRSSITDGMAVLTAEFEYGKDFSEALTDVSNALSKVKGKLPQNIKDPAIYRVFSNTAPVLVYAVYPTDNSLSLADVRQLAENQIKDQLLKVEGVENIDIFGGYRKELYIKLDRKKLDSFNIPLELVIRKIRESNITYPAGFIINETGYFLIKYDGKFKDINRIKDLIIRDNIKLEDIASIQYGYPDNFSLYFGNGKKAIAIAVQRSIDASALDTIYNVKAKVKELERLYPSLKFEIADTQERIISLSISNMFEALRDAIIFVSIVIFLFLANIRQMIVAALSIPFVYSITIGFMWLFDIQFNIVTLTAVILALGMLIDDAVVVLENIERHLHQLGEDVKTAVLKGTEEVMLAILGGTVATSSVLIPLLFVGDYPEKIFRPLSETLLIALWVSYFVSITFIPLISPYILKKTAGKNIFEKKIYQLVSVFLEPLKKVYTGAVKKVIYGKVHPLIYFIPLIAVLILSVRFVIPVLGNEMMPPMDTGIVKINVIYNSNIPPEKIEKLTEKINRIIASDKNVEKISTAVGSEPGVLSMGSNSPQAVMITVTYNTRFDRDKDIWTIQRDLYKKISEIPDVKYVSVFEYGATPMSNIKGTVDIMVSGDDLNKLDSIGNEILKRMEKVVGLKSIYKNWDMDKITYRIVLDNKKLEQFGITPYVLIYQLSTYIKGINVSLMNIQNENPIGIRLILPKSDRAYIDQIQDYYIDTPKGKVPFSVFAKLEEIVEPTIITRQDLKYTMDIIGFREKGAVTHIAERTQNVLQDLKLPQGYEISDQGEVKQLSDSLGRMFKAIGFGIVLLFFSMVPTFRSFSAPTSIISAIPLAVIGGIWALLIADYHRSLPAMMGLILLSGIIVKNSILLIDFIIMHYEENKDLKKAVLESINIRTRPVLMTAFATSAGMIPIAFAWALGLERLAPLAVVAIGGLIIGTFLTLIFVPLVYYYLRNLSNSSGSSGGEK